MERTKAKASLSRALLQAGVIASGLAAATGQANDGPPVGIDIAPVAGNCEIGPFPRFAKAGMYNKLCESMTDSEKCLALLKAHFVGSEIREDANFNHRLKERTEFCLEHFRTKLGL